MPISPATLAVRRALRLARRNAVGAKVMSALALTANQVETAVKATAPTLKAACQGSSLVNKAR